MASTKEHMERALMYLKQDRPYLYMIENELENALSHYLIENEKKDERYLCSCD